MVLSVIAALPIGSGALQVALMLASASADGSSLTVTGVAEDGATMSVTACDTDGNQVSDSFSVSIVPAPQPIAGTGRSWHSARRWLTLR